MPSDFALAIAHAEGFNVEGSAPNRAHNPGSLKPIGWKGPVTGAEGIAVFQDDATGWAALEAELSLIRRGASHVYVRTMTLKDMASHYTDSADTAWAANVADWFCEHGRSQTTVETKIGDLLG